MQRWRIPIGMALAGLALVLVSLRLAPASVKTGATQTEMHNVNYHYGESLQIHIRYLQGTLIPTRKNVPPTFDDRNSFSISIDSAAIAISSGGLTTLMDQYVFARPGSPIKNLKIRLEGGKLKQTGAVHKGTDLPFEMSAEVSATPDGRIKLHPTSFKIIHVPAEGALHALGLHLQDLVNPAGAPGVQIVKDDLLLDPSRMLPAPRIQGRIREIRIEGDEMVQFFGAGRNIDSPSRNYMRFRGGIIRFGKLTMRDADLSLIDDAPHDPFEFSLERYKDQLVAGYSKTTPSFGLDVFMPDVTKLSRGRHP